MTTCASNVHKLWNKKKGLKMILQDGCIYLSETHIILFVWSSKAWNAVVSTSNKLKLRHMEWVFSQISKTMNDRKCAELGVLWKHTTNCWKSFVVLFNAVDTVWLLFTLVRKQFDALDSGVRVPKELSLFFAIH